MSHPQNARLLCVNGPLIHYGLRSRDEMRGDDIGNTVCNIQYYTGTPPGRAQDHLIQAIIVDDEPVTCVICAVDYGWWCW